MKKNKAPKLPFGIDEAFYAEVASLDIPGKKALVARIEAGKHEAKEFLKENESIVSLRGTLKEVEGPARDSIKAANNRQKYLIEELKRLGEFVQ